VPASEQDLENELAPLADDLDALSEEADEIRQAALREAERRRQAAAREAASLRERAREDAVAELTRAALRQRAQGQQNGVEAQASAKREVQRIEAAGEERIASLLEEVLECVRRSGL
jgi:hypothetical protein